MPSASRAFGPWGTGGARVHERGPTVDSYFPMSPPNLNPVKHTWTEVILTVKGDSYFITSVIKVSTTSAAIPGIVCKVQPVIITIISLLTTKIGFCRYKILAIIHNVKTSNHLTSFCFIVSVRLRIFLANLASLRI